MKNLTLKRFKTGKTININVTGEPSEVAKVVNQFYNHAIVANIPEDYNEGTDFSVVVQTSRQRLLLGLIGMAHTELKGRTRYFREKVKAATLIVHAAHLLKMIGQEDEIETAA